jgi:hypothetical protein
MITCRDRPILTQKLIESLYETVNVFSEINIYTFDNLSELSDERMSIFSNLLKNKKIVYYSYDTQKSSHNCFSKAISFNRWINMMEVDNFILSNKDNQYKSKKHYYSLIDNDMLFGRGWDEYFISAIEQLETNLKNKENNIHYLVKWPGGIPGNARKESRMYSIQNSFNRDNFQIGTSGFGGGSGFWFMNFEMINKLHWKNANYLNTYNSFKKHDTTTWSIIREKLGQNNDLKYVCGVIPPHEESNPLVIHLGSQFGSICNSEEYKDRNYNALKPTFLKKEQEILNSSASEIFELFKTKCNNW